MTLQGINTVASMLVLRSNNSKIKGTDTDKGRHDKSEFLKAKKEMADAREDVASSPRAVAPDASGRGPLVASSDDPHEMDLFYEYQQKLVNYRRNELLAISSPGPSSDQPRGLLAIHRASDGSLRAKKEQVEPKDEPEVKVNEELNDELFDGAMPEPDASENDGLDPYTKAAIAPLRHRNEKKKAEAKAAAKAEKEAAAAAAADGAADGRSASVTRKRPAAAEAVKPSKAVKTERVPQKGEAASLKVVPKSQILSAMPKVPKDGSNPSPVLYKKDIIYTSVKSKRFRALVDRLDVYTENSRAWGAAKPTKEAWASAVKAIDDKTKIHRVRSGSAPLASSGASSDRGPLPVERLLQTLARHPAIFGACVRCWVVPVRSYRGSSLSGIICLRTYRSPKVRWSPGWLSFAGSMSSVATSPIARLLLWQLS